MKLSTILISLALICLPVLSAAKINQTADGNDSGPGRILFFGNSLTAGYGVLPSQAFPRLIQNKIDSLGWHFEAVNAGLSGETSSGGLRRIDWVLRQPVDVLVLELGGNDALRGIDLSLTEKNLQGIIDKTLARYPETAIIIAGMQVPGNFGASYADQFASIFPRLAKHNRAALIPFLLEDVGGIPELNQADGIHPTAKGQRIIAETVWQTLQPVLKKIQHAGKIRF